MVVSPSLAGVIRALPLVVSLTVVTGLHVVLGEQVPKIATLRGPEGVALKVAPWMDLFRRAFHPFVWLLDRVSSGVVRLLGMEPVGSHSTIYTVDELRQIVRESEELGVLEEEEEHMLQAVFDLRAIRASQVMVPRTEMVCVRGDTRLAELVEQAAGTSLTKFPVFEDDLDEIVGVVHVKDMVRPILEQRADLTARELMREVLFLPETVSVGELLTALRRARQHIAILVDEYGGTAGLVTLEDLLEEIVGDVQDAFDKEEPTIRWLQDGSALIDGLVQIDEVNEMCQVSLQDPYYTTIGGLVMGRLDRVPVVGDELILEDGAVRLRVEEMDGLRVALVRLIRTNSLPTDEATA